MVHDQLLAQVKNHIGFLSKSLQEVGQSGCFPGRTELKDYKKQADQVDHEKYVQCAHQHYFVARVLFLRNVIWYSKFCGQQCVENYLKAYIKSRGETPKRTHDLAELRIECQRVAGGAPFCDESVLDIVISQLNGFNEFARYPTAKYAPGQSTMGYYWPDDIYVLDYFVYRMREIIPRAQDGWNLFEDGHYELVACQESFPEFYNILKQDNINFG